DQKHEIWPGINAATLALLTGADQVAGQLAEFVRGRCLEQLGQLPPGDGERYWVLATLGEAALVRGARAEAEDWYGQAAQEGAGRLGDLQTPRRNADLILQHHDPGCDRHFMRRLLRIPSVAMFVGHMVDRPGRRFPRFPPSLEPAVTAALRQK